MSGIAGRALWRAQVTQLCTTLRTMDFECKTQNCFCSSARTGAVPALIELEMDAANDHLGEVGPSVEDHRAHSVQAEVRVSEPPPPPKAYGAVFPELGVEAFESTLRRNCVSIS